jgi:hypothetical protein
MNNIKLSVSLLREHSEHLRKISTALSDDLSQLNLALSEQAGDDDTEELRLLVGLAELNRSLFVATDIFYQRLHKLLERRKGGNGLTAGNQSE